MPISFSPVYLSYLLNHGHPSLCIHCVSGSQESLQGKAICSLNYGTFACQCRETYLSLTPHSLCLQQGFHWFWMCLQYAAVITMRVYSLKTVALRWHLYLCSSWMYFWVDTRRDRCCSFVFLSFSWHNLSTSQSYIIWHWWGRGGAGWGARKKASCRWL